MKYRFMNEHRHAYSLVLMCRVLKVARAGFYQWLHKPLSDRAIEDQRLIMRPEFVYIPGVVQLRETQSFLKKAERIGPACRMRNWRSAMR